MRFHSMILGVACLLGLVLPAGAAELAKLERVLAKEPQYQGKPKYCLLVFGPEAKFRVWLVLDGNTLYVDRNGNGDLTEPGKRVANAKGEVGAMTPPDGKTIYDLWLRNRENIVLLGITTRDGGV